MEAFTEDDKEVLVGIVKIARLKRMRGSKGTWLEFIKSREGDNYKIANPQTKSWDTLSDFVATFTSHQDIKMVARVKKWVIRKQRWLSLSKYLGTSPAQELVRLTYQHPKFQKLYAFSSYEKGWVVTKIRMPKTSDNDDQMISIDCEMGICDDGTSEVIQVCGVDQNFEVIINTLVKPSKPISDYLTHITGISAKDMESVECCLADVQKTLKKAMKGNTILVGHALYNDLQVLRLDHAKVIDTSLIFQIKDRPINHTPKLIDLSKVVLNWDFREEGKPHNCLDDAIAPMKLVFAKIKYGLTNPLEIECLDSVDQMLSKLFISKIPHCVTTDDLKKLFPDIPVIFKDFSYTRNQYKCTQAVFSKIENAEEAFEKLKGELGKDKHGRLEKCVPVRKLLSGALLTCFVRKTKPEKVASIDSGNANAKRHFESSFDLLDIDGLDSFVHGKRLKKGTYSADISGIYNSLPKASCCCNYYTESEKIREEIRKKDLEIGQLRSIITTLQRMQNE